MDLIESVKMATATLTANRLRSALTMLGMIIGNASVVAMIGATAPSPYPEHWY
jgi:putative ABC transport system permease protein